MPYVTIVYMNHWTGKKHSKEAKEKMRLAKLGKKQSPEQIEKRASKIRGRKFSLEHRIKISEAQKGEKGNNWKGEEATYNSIHHWIRKTFGNPNTCEECGGYFEGRKIEWANISGEYKRERSDWKRLCAKCHRKYDRENVLKTKRLYSHG